MPIFFIGIIVFAFIGEGYLDDYLLPVILLISIIFYVYLRSNYNKTKYSKKELSARS